MFKLRTILLSAFLLIAFSALHAHQVTFTSVAQKGVAVCESWTQIRLKNDGNHGHRQPDVVIVLQREATHTPAISMPDSLEAFGFHLSNGSGDVDYSGYNYPGHDCKPPFRILFGRSVRSLAP